MQKVEFFYLEIELPDFTEIEGAIIKKKNRCKKNHSQNFKQ